MKFSTRIILAMALGFTFGLAESAPSQDSGRGNKPSKHPGKITREYDQDHDQSKLSLQMMPVTCFKDGCIFFGLHTSYTGKQPKAPLNRFIFTLYIFTKTLEPFADSTLDLQVDGKAIEVGAMTYVGKESKNGLMVLCYGVPLYEEEVAKIARASHVEARIGSVQFTLGEDHINAINDFHRQATSNQLLKFTTRLTSHWSGRGIRESLIESLRDYGIVFRAAQFGR